MYTRPATSSEHDVTPLYFAPSTLPCWSHQVHILLILVHRFQVGHVEGAAPGRAAVAPQRKPPAVGQRCWHGKPLRNVPFTHTRHRNKGSWTWPDNAVQGLSAGMPLPTLGRALTLAAPAAPRPPGAGRGSAPHACARWQWGHPAPWELSSQQTCALSGVRDRDGFRRWGLCE